MAVVVVIKWAFRHYALTYDEYDTLDEAVEAAVWAQEDGAESLDSIEVIDDGGTRTVYDRGALGALMAPISNRRNEVERERPQPTVVLDLQGPGGQWTSEFGYADADAAEESAARYRSILGPGRVRVRSLSGGTTP